MTKLTTLRIYLDMCSYNRPFDNQTQMKIRLETEAKLFIQANTKAGKYFLVWSYMLDKENYDNPYEERRNAISPWKKIASLICSSSDEILSTGIDIIKKGIKAKDALHIACAIKSGCDYFITTDKGLYKKDLAEIKIINPIDFVRETEDLI